MPDPDQTNAVRQPTTPGLAPDHVTQIFGDSSARLDWNIEMKLGQCDQIRRDTDANIALVRAIHALDVDTGHPLSDVVAIAKVFATKTIDGYSNLNSDQLMRQAFLVLVLALVGRDGDAARMLADLEAIKRGLSELRDRAQMA